MKKTLLFSLVILMAGSSAVFAQKVKPVKVKMLPYTAKKCVNDNSCVEYNLSWPMLSGGNAQAVRAINDSIRSFVYIAADADPDLPLSLALDTAMAYSYAMLQEQAAGMDGYDIGYFYELESKVLLNNGRYFSLSMSNFVFTGGAHPNHYTQLGTYDLNTGRLVALGDIISDTLALRPMLGKAFVEEKSETGEPVPALSDIVFEEFKHLPMPLNYAVLPDGVCFYYNTYEVAAYVFGPTDITLTWAQLGALADRKKWQ